jgi:hypothetical protein
MLTPLSSEASGKSNFPKPIPCMFEVADSHRNFAWGLASLWAASGLHN